MIVSGAGLGVDYGALWDSVKSAGSDLITKDIPRAAGKAISKKASEVATPVVQQMASQKASAAVSKGNVIAFTLGGVAVGALISGGGIHRRIAGGLVVGALGALAGFKIGLLIDSM